MQHGNWSHDCKVHFPMPAHFFSLTPIAMSSILKLLRVLSRDPTLSLSYEQSKRDPDNFGIYASTHLMQTCSSSTTHPTHLVHGLNTVAGPYTHPSGLLDMSSADWYISSAIKVEWASLTVKVELACSAMLAGPACSIVNMERAQIVPLCTQPLC